MHYAIQPNGVFTWIRKSATEWETNYSITNKYDSVIQQHHYDIVEIESVLQYVTQSCHGERNSNVSDVLVGVASVQPNCTVEFGNPADVPTAYPTP